MAWEAGGKVPETPTRDQQGQGASSPPTGAVPRSLRPGAVRRPAQCRHDVRVPMKTLAGSEAGNGAGPRTDGLPAPDVVARIDELLEISYRSGDLGNVPCILDEAIYILLSLQTRETVYQRVFRDLKETFGTWREVLKTSEEDLVEILRPAGFQLQRARKLRRLLAAVASENEQRGLDENGGQDLTLDHIRTLSATDAERFLKSLPGIGTKSARCIALYALSYDAFPVDTHVERVFDRLGLVNKRGSKPAHDEYQNLVPAPTRRRLHINLIHHGRAVCRSDKPRCSRCTLVSFCDAGRSSLLPHPEGAVDLCAGAGGLGEGFTNAGFRVLAAVELDAIAAQTYRANHPGVPVLEADVTKVTGERLRLFAPALGRPAVTIAGPPCQGFSAAGPRDPHADRNYLYEQVIRIATELESASVVIENVPGVARVRGIEFADPILDELRDAGFVAEQYLLQGPDFGVPQRRKRLFFIGIAESLGVVPTPPRPTARPPGTIDDGRAETPTLTELLKRLPDRPHGVPDDRLELGDGSVVYNAGTMAHCDRVVAKISKIVPGNGPISYRRLDIDLARTIIAGHRALPVHPWLDRAISVREAALIQGFAMGYVFCGRRSDQPLQVANAVPPPLAAGVAAHLLRLLHASSAWPDLAATGRPTSA